MKSLKELDVKIDKYYEEFGEDAPTLKICLTPREIYLVLRTVEIRAYNYATWISFHSDRLERVWHNGALLLRELNKENN